MSGGFKIVCLDMFSLNISHFKFCIVTGLLPLLFTSTWVNHLKVQLCYFSTFFWQQYPLLPNTTDVQCLFTVNIYVRYRKACCLDCTWCIKITVKEDIFIPQNSIMWETALSSVEKVRFQTYNDRHWSDCVQYTQHARSIQTMHWFNQLLKQVSGS